MNIARLNVVSSGDAIIRGSGVSGGGGSKPSSTIKYYDCLFDSEEGHGEYGLDNVKVIGESGATMIAPDAYINGENYQRVAVAVDMGKKTYIDGEWVNIKDYLVEADGFNPDTHIEITEEEFYHIPEDAVFDVSKEEDRKALMNILYPLAKRYYENYGVTSLTFKPYIFKSLHLIDTINNYDIKPRVVSIVDHEGIINPNGKELIRIGSGLEYFLYHDPATDNYYGEFVDY